CTRSSPTTRPLRTTLESSRVRTSRLQASPRPTSSGFSPSAPRSSVTVAAPSAGRTPLTRNQIFGFWAAWGGFALDGMDSFIFALVLGPAMTELLPKSGIPATPANIAYWGSGVLFALFLVGWGVSMVWGPVADRFGRVRTLSLTILCYSVFTLAAAFATSI